jgi:hypothetical protein
MENATHLGLDVHKDTIAVAVLRPDEAEPDERTIAHTDSSHPWRRSCAAPSSWPSRSKAYCCSLAFTSRLPTTSRVSLGWCRGMRLGRDGQSAQADTVSGYVIRLALPTLLTSKRLSVEVSNGCLTRQVRPHKHSCFPNRAL